MLAVAAGPEYHALPVRCVGIILVICLLTAASCTCDNNAVVGPQRADVRPMRDLLFPRPIENLGDAFADYQPVVIDGVHVEGGASNPSGIRQWVRHATNA